MDDDNVESKRRQMEKLAVEAGLRSHQQWIAEQKVKPGDGKPKPVDVKS